MRADDVHNRVRNALVLRHLRAVARVGGQYGRAHARVGAVVRIVAHLVFLEVAGALQLAHVVVIRAHAGEQRVRAHLVRGGLGQIGHDDGMVIRARRFQQKPSQKRLVGVGKLNQLGRRDHVEHPL